MRELDNLKINSHSDVEIIRREKESYIAILWGNCKFK